MLFMMYSLQCDVEPSCKADRYAILDWTETSRGRQISTCCLPKCSEMVDVSLLHSPTFIILCIAIVIPFFGQLIAYQPKSELSPVNLSIDHLLIAA